MKLWTAVSGLKASANTVTYAESLSYLSAENVRLVEQFRPASSAGGDFVRRRCSFLTDLCQELTATLNVTRMMELRDSFSELLMFVRLAGLFSVERVAEEAGKKTPDFQVLEDKTLFIELKALTVVDGALKHGKIIADGLKARIELEAKINDGSPVATSSQVIQPHQKSGKPYDPWSVKLVTENLIGKIDQNISKEQFSRGPTVLLIDLCDELLLHGVASENLQREYGSPPTSGELWHAAFGKIGAQMKKAQEFEMSASDVRAIQHETLQMEGVLRRFPFVRGIVFHYRNQFWGAAYRHRRNVKVIDFLQKLCEEVAIEPGQPSGLFLRAVVAQIASQFSGRRR
jgi:hypothetical protein